MANNSRDFVSLQDRLDQSRNSRGMNIGRSRGEASFSPPLPSISSFTFNPSNVTGSVSNTSFTTSTTTASWWDQPVNRERFERELRMLDLPAHGLTYEKLINSIASSKKSLSANIPASFNNEAERAKWAADWFKEIHIPYSSENTRTKTLLAILKGFIKFSEIPAYAWSHNQYALEVVIEANNLVEREEGYQEEIKKLSKKIKELEELAYPENGQMELF